MIELDDDLELQDLIDMDILVKLQDSLHSVLGISTGVADTNGVALASHSSWTDFCGGHIKKSKRGLAACENCDKQGMISAMESKCAMTYQCHTGLTDFAVPIVIGGKNMGCFLGGQVATKPLTRSEVNALARRYEIDPDELWESSKKIRIIRQELLDEIAQFVYDVASIISGMAYQRYQLSKSNLEIERAAQMKSDFLANMSHEIRTPMNAVIGMAEMTLREELPPLAREYVNLIISSGKTLLTIINDILDFSKIESGKMDIIEDEYELMSVIYDIATMITTRIGDKKIELIIDIDPELPNKLHGDSIRIKQVLVNLVNNAVKFTKEGKVGIRVSYEKTAEDEIDLRISVEDTGMGIRDADKEHLFQSFHQLDSKRNRNIEGTGLGLAISQRLVSLMHGDIEVESEYGVGSTFSFHVPQGIVEEQPCVSLKEKKSVVYGLIGNPYVRDQLRADVTKLGDTFYELKGEGELKQRDHTGVSHIFVEDGLFTDQVKQWLREKEDIVGVLVAGYYADVESDIPNLIVLRRPVYVLNVAMILNHEDIHASLFEDERENFDFIAPDANILIVDDNKVNLTVAEGLLAPLKMQIDTAISGQEAVAMISVKRYDLIFMDHMMPEIDGVETTRLIRRFHPEYSDVPIIALTANAVEGTKELFLSEGMNDFVAKPIELRIITSKLKHWLPKEKLQKIAAKTDEKKEKTHRMRIEGLDTGYALSLLGSESLYQEVLKDYYQIIDKKADQIRELYQKEDWQTYTVEVHALKSASRQIGALALSELAAELEAAGNDGDLDKIYDKTDEMLAIYRQLKGVLRPHVQIEEEVVSDRGAVSGDEIRMMLDAMRAALEELDIDQMEEMAETLSHYEYDVEQSELLGQLCMAVEDLDVDRCEEVVLAWEALL